MSGSNDPRRTPLSVDPNAPPHVSPYATRPSQVQVDPVANNAAALETMANRLETIRINHGHTLHADVLAALQAVVVEICGMLHIPSPAVAQDGAQDRAAPPPAASPGRPSTPSAPPPRPGDLPPVA